MTAATWARPTKTWATLAADGITIASLGTFDATLVPGSGIPAAWTYDVTSIVGVEPGWTLSGSTFIPPVTQLASELIAAASSACANLTAQVVPDQTHQNAYVNAAAMVGPSATVPTVDPAKTSFANLAAAYGAQPQAFATLVAEIAAASCQLSAALATLSVAAEAATSVAQLDTALQAFETSLGSIVSSIMSAGISVSSPPAISILGIND